MLNSNLYGRYRIEFIERGEVVCEVKTNNIITDAGLVRMGEIERFARYCQLGSGSTPELATDTKLVAPYPNGVGSDYFEVTMGEDDGGKYAEGSKTFDFPEGRVVGLVTEIGVGWSPTIGNALFSRALVRDSEGLPTAIQVQSSWAVRVHYYLRNYIPDKDVVSSFVLKEGLDISNTHSVTVRPAMTSKPTYFWGWYAGINQNRLFKVEVSQRGLSPENTRPSLDSSQTGESINLTIPSNGIPGVQSGNTSVLTVQVPAFTDIWQTGIKTMTAQLGGCCYQFEFNPPIKKEEGKTLNLKIEYTWGRR